MNSFLFFLFQCKSMNKCLLLMLLIVLPLVQAASVKLFINYDGSADVYYEGLESASDIIIPEDAIDKKIEGSDRNYFVSFNTQTITQKQGTDWRIEYYSLIDGMLTVRFPAGATITASDGKIVAEDGLIYVNKEIKKDEEYSVGYSLYAKEQDGFFIYVITALIVLTVGYLAYSLQSRKPRLKAEQEVRVDNNKLELLPDTERKVIDFLLRHDGATQKDVEAGVSLPKSTLSRVMKNLENKEFLERKKVGLSKKIFLSQSFLEQIKE